MNLISDKLVEVLSMLPDPILSSTSMGARKPSTTSEIPAVVISLNIENYKGTGIGRVTRSGDIVVQNTAVIEVRSTPETFSSDLKTLRIWPLPLKKNPSSVSREFTDGDIRVSNIRDITHPIVYRMVAKPTRKGEYKLDIPKAQIIFGDAQVEGEKIEIVHWTVTWREDILGNRYIGSVNLEIWANNFGEADALSRKIQNKLKTDSKTLRQRGFIKLQPVSLEPFENVQNDPPSGSPFSVWKQKLAYNFAFETEEGGELSSGMAIKRIDIEMDEHFVESFSIP